MVALVPQLAPGDGAEVVIDEWDEIVPRVRSRAAALAKGRELPADIMSWRVVHRERAPAEVPSVLRVVFSRRFPRLLMGTCARARHDGIAPHSPINM